VAPKNRGFRVMASIDGELVTFPAGVRSRVEGAIATRTGGWVHARGSGEEFWIIGRRDLDMLLLGRRLPKHRPTAARRGALGHDLAQMLVLASERRSTDVFLDPFAGSGSIVVARLDFPARRVIYADSEYRRLRTELRPELGRAARVDFLDEDARILPSLSDGTVDVVVTDPPWGEYRELDSTFGEFATDLSASLHRVLHPQTGRFVMLIARRATRMMVDALEGAGLTVAGRYEVLVNGHPATVLVGGRVASVPCPQVTTSRSAMI
jgi:predicted RNA methylase